MFMPITALSNSLETLIFPLALQLQDIGVPLITPKASLRIQTIYLYQDENLLLVVLYSTHWHFCIYFISISILANATTVYLYLVLGRISYNLIEMSCFCNRRYWLYVDLIPIWAPNDMQYVWSWGHIIGTLSCKAVVNIAISREQRSH